MNKTRPVFLDLTKIHFPPPAIISILHRISGFIIFLLIPLFLWMLDKSLSSANGFSAIAQDIDQPWVKFIVWVLLSSLLLHLVAGIRHLLMDGGVAEEKQSGRASSWVALIISIILIILAGIWLW